MTDSRAANTAFSILYRIELTVTFVDPVLMGYRQLAFSILYRIELTVTAVR